MRSLWPQLWWLFRNGRRSQWCRRHSSRVWITLAYSWIILAIRPYEWESRRVTRSRLSTRTCGPLQLSSSAPIEKTCHLSESRRSSSALLASLQQKQRGLQVQRVTGKGPRNESTCAKNGTRIPIDVNEYCKNHWKPCPKWNPVARKCTILYDTGDFQIHNNPCWFRVTVSNVAYNRSALIHTPPHSKILAPDPVVHYM